MCTWCSRSSFVIWDALPDLSVTLSCSSLRGIVGGYP